MSKIDIAILGAAGLTGKELLHIFKTHPHFSPVHITSDRHAGLSIDEVFPDLSIGNSSIVFKKHSDPIPSGIPVLLAVPNETSLSLTPDLLKKGHRVIDLSGVFRLHNRAAFERYYKLEHTSFDLMNDQVFGMPELFRDKIPGANLIANPGCYATGAILPLYMLKDQRKKIASIVIDGKSGVSGAGGRVEDAGFSFQSVYENFRAYKILQHQHTPEMQEYAAWGQEPFSFPIIFTPHLLPVYRGILTTTVIHWKEKAPEAEDIVSILRDNTKGEPFIRIYDKPEQVELRMVQHTNFIDISARTEGQVTVMVSAIDNLMKGAAGQAVQNLNLMMGLPETTGLIFS